MPDYKPLKPAHHLILLLLAEEAASGIELLDRIETRGGSAMAMNAGSLYRTIAALVERGLVEPVEDPSPAQGRPGAPRKAYSVTDAGVGALRAEAERQAELLAATEALGILGDAS